MRPSLPCSTEPASNSNGGACDAAPVGCTDVAVGAGGGGRKEGRAASSGGAVQASQKVLLEPATRDTATEDDCGERHSTGNCTVSMASAWERRGRWDAQIGGG